MCCLHFSTGNVVFNCKLAGISENCFFTVAGSSLGSKVLVVLSLLDVSSFKSVSASVTSL